MDLVEVQFVEAGRSVFVQPGTTLLAAAGMAGVEIATGCTRGMCGTDAVAVDLDAAGALDAPSPTERGTLERMGLAATGRLACSARVCSGRVRVLGDALR
jgi:ferredoxin